MNNSLFKLRNEVWKLPRKETLESISGLYSVLFASRQVASDSAKNPGAFKTPKASRDLLLDFRHADIVLTLIIGERYLFVSHESKCFGFEIPKTLEQVSGFCLEGATAFSGLFEGGRALSVTTFKNIALTASETCRSLIT